MPLVRATSNSNIRKLRKGKRPDRWFYATAPSTAASPLAMAATGTFNIFGASTATLTQDEDALRTYGRSEGSGRDARIEILMTGMIEVETFPVDDESEFVMIKRISPLMPNPVPLDSKGRPT